MMDYSLSLFLAGLIASAAPLVLASLGETITEKAGIINLSLDGTILLAAMTGFVTALKLDSLLAGYLAAALTGAAVALILALISIHLGQSQVATGFALTFFCRDLAYFLGSPHARTQGPQSAHVAIAWLSDIPFAGQVLFDHQPIVYLSMFAILLSWFFLYRSAQGLILRCVGENPEACWARGIQPKKIQTIYTLAGGALVGMAGAAYSLAIKPGWGRPQGCEGIGWIALAIVIFGGWHPLKVAVGAYLFAFLQMLGIVLQDIFPSLPAQVFQVAPFPLMIFALVLVHLGQQRNKTSRHPLLERFFNNAPPASLGQGHQQL